MNETQLLNELRRIVCKYISDNSLRQYLEKNIVKTKVKFVLAELDRHRNKEISKSDKEIIKDIFFHFG